MLNIVVGHGGGCVLFFWDGGWYPTYVGYLWIAKGLLRGLHHLVVWGADADSDYGVAVQNYLFDSDVYSNVSPTRKMVSSKSQVADGVPSSSSGVSVAWQWQCVLDRHNFRPTTCEYREARVKPSFMGNSGKFDSE